MRRQDHSDLGGRFGVVLARELLAVLTSLKLNSISNLFNHSIKSFVEFKTTQSLQNGSEEDY